jgi:hypothetical protein
MLTGLSAEILSYVERHEFGVKLADLQERIRRPHQEIEAAVSQLKRQQLIEQRVPGIWTRTNNNTGRKEPEPVHARIVETGVAERRLLREDTIAVDTPIGPVPVVVSVFHETSAQPITQERTMPRGKGTKTCAKCKETKGVTAFSKGEEACRKCTAGKPAAAAAKATKEPKPAKPKKQLRAIVNRHVGKSNSWAKEAIAHLEGEIAARQSAIEVLRKVA